jgi:hypothetical protein
MLPLFSSYLSIIGQIPNDHNNSQLHTPIETKGEIHRQLSLSTESNGTKKTKDAMSSTGVREAATALIIVFLLEMGKTLRKHGPGEPA